MNLSERRVGPGPPLAVTSIIVSMMLIAVGNGIIFAYVPLKLAAVGLPPWIAGAAVTALAGGGLVGCLATGRLVRRVGHARAFAALAALVTLSVLALAVEVMPALWVASRALYGAAATGLFIVTQSWLNDACDNAWRGRAIATFYMSYVLAIGAGSYLLRFFPVEGVSALLASLAFSTLAILPVSLTRLRTPPPPEVVTVEIREVWRISPVGLIGLLAVGGLTMLVQGFAPIYAAASGYAKADVALLMLLMQFGMLGVQLPLGAVSDRTDRRFVLVASAALVVTTSLLATQLTGAALGWVILVFAVWSGATESIYAVANAHANDRADPRHYVSLSSTLLVAWSVSGFVFPAIATVLTEVVGPHAFMYLAAVVAALYAVFVVYRLRMKEAVPPVEAEPYQPISAQAPLTAELAPLAGEADGDGPPLR